MAPEKKLIAQWLETIPDSKLDMRFYDREVTIKADYRVGYRLDHQGMNKNEAEVPYIHRLYIQPVGGASKQSRTSVNSTNAVVCRCHATEDATPDEIREAIIFSFLSRKDNDPALCGYAPPKNT